MEKILALIEQKKQKFSNLPLFQFMQDTSIDPRQRLAFAPCLAHFVMSFGELNKSVFRQEPTTDKVQEIINKHTYEDDHHWVWFLRDINQLGLNRSMNFNDMLRFIWSEKTNISRRLSYELYRYTYQASPIQKLVVIEVVEATANVFSSTSTGVARELQAITQKKYLYFGESQLVAETGHIADSQKEKQFIEDIKLTEIEQTKYFELVEKVFELFTEFTHELLAYTKAHNVSQLSVETEESDRLLQIV